MPVRRCRLSVPSLNGHTDTIAASAPMEASHWHTSSGANPSTSTACSPVILEQYANDLVPADLERLEPFLRDAKTWALVDILAGDVAATIVRAHPDDPRVDVVLRRWAGDDDFWVRRAALLAHLQMFGRHGGFEGWDRFCAIADELLEEREFFVRKAIGWVLREAGKRRSDLVADFVRPRVSRISGVSIREAVRYLDPADRDALMAGYGSGGRGPNRSTRSS